MLLGIARQRSKRKIMQTDTTDATLRTFNVKHYRSVLGLLAE